jgi:hypothetical protein
MDTGHCQFCCGVSHSLCNDTRGRRPLILATIMAARCFHGDFDVHCAFLCSAAFD